MIPSKVHASWHNFIEQQHIQVLLKTIESQIGMNYNPIKKEQILRFLEVDLSKVKVIWLGQDVYPQEGVATGRSFEVGNLVNWNEPFKQASIRNIIRVIMKDFYSGQLRTFNEIRKDINEGILPLKQPKEWFDSLEQQGVLFLNCYLTCEVGKENSHKHIWEPFSKELIKYINSTNPSIIWFLWGKEAQAQNSNFINVCKSNHPSMLFPKNKEDFSYFEGFTNTKEIIHWLG